MQTTTTTKLSQKERLLTFSGSELLPVTRDGKTYAGTSGALAQLVAPLAAHLAPVTQEATASAAAAAAAKEQAQQAASRAGADAAQATASAATSTAAATAAAADAAAAAAARDAAQLSSGIYPSTAVGLASTADGQYFSVPATDDAESLILYRHVGADAAEQARYPSAAAASLVRDNKHDDGERALEFSDELGFLLGWLSSVGTLDLPTMRVEHDGANSGLQFFDAMGFVLATIGGRETQIGGLSWELSQAPGIEITDEQGFVLGRFDGIPVVPSPEEPATPALPDVTPYLSGRLCGVAGVPVELRIRNAMSWRSDTERVVATLASRTTACVETSQDALRVDVASLGAEADLHVRPESGDASFRKTLPISVKCAPNPHPGPAPAPKVLLIGDSIFNRQGGTLTRAWLESWGYSPQFIGTMRGSGAATNANDVTGELGEAREGWETGDYTLAINDRAVPIAPGDEAAYLAMSKTDQWPRNPFIRAATQADDPAVVRNGYVVDFGFYQARFGLPAPDVVVYGLGTNDIRDRTEAEIYAAVYDNDLLIIKAMRAAWPSARIIRTLPGTARTPARDAIWSSKYVPVLKAMMDAQATLADPLLTLCPAWAMTTQEAGFNYAASETDPTSGARTTSWSDPVHPVGAARQQLFRAVAGYIACAAVQLI